VKSFWRWTGAIFFALVFVFLVLTGIGTSLPIEHHATCSTAVDAPAKALFDQVSDDATSVRWRPDIASAVLVTGNGPTAVWRETDAHGNALTYRTTAYVEGHTLTRTIDYVPGMAFAGKWTFEFVALPVIGTEPTYRTQLTITEDGMIYNPFFRFLARYLVGYAQSMQSYLADAGRLGFGPLGNTHWTVSCAPVR
jgi:polyketide cyclase/dehydrase/lipid transport protein